MKFKIKKKNHEVKIVWKRKYCPYKAIWSYFSEISIKCWEIFVRSEFYEKFWDEENFTWKHFENFRVILDNL